MKISAYSPPPASSVPGVPDEAKEWIDSVLESRDDHLKTLTQALTSRLDFANNLNCEVREISVPDAVEVELILRNLKSKPIGVLHLWNEDADDVALTWKQSDTNKIKITCTFSASPADEVLTRILIVGE